MSVSETGKTAYAKVGVWYNQETGRIHMSLPDTSWFVTTVSNDPKSKRYHPNLFKKLSRFLKEQGAPGPELEGLQRRG